MKKLKHHQKFILYIAQYTIKLISSLKRQGSERRDTNKLSGSLCFASTVHRNMNSGFSVDNNGTDRSCTKARRRRGVMEIRTHAFQPAARDRVHISSFDSSFFLLSFLPFPLSAFSCSFSFSHLSPSARRVSALSVPRGDLHMLGKRT